MMTELIDCIESTIYVEGKTVIFKSVGYVECDDVKEDKTVCEEQRYLTLYEILNGKI